MNLVEGRGLGREGRVVGEAVIDGRGGDEDRGQFEVKEGDTNKVRKEVHKHRFKKL